MLRDHSVSNLKKEFIFKEMFSELRYPVVKMVSIFNCDRAAKALQTHVPFHALAPTFNFN